MRLQRNDTLLLVIDVQEKLMPVIDRAAQTERNIERLVRGFHILDIPAILTEQYVRGLGPTTPAIKTAFEESGGYTPIEKSCFSSYGCSEFLTELRNRRKKHVVVAGVETHVCVYQTVSDLLANGYDVTVVADAVSSRTPENREIGIRRMTADGARLSSTEMVLFELTVESGTDEFRSIARLVK
jgi:nicotinamidase-related amidase